MKKVREKKSKRMNLNHKYNIEKKVRVHQAKLRKEAKKMAHLKKKSRDPPIPNSCPFKRELIESF